MKRTVLVLTIVFSGLLLTAQPAEKKAKEILDKFTSVMNAYEYMRFEFSYIMENKEEDIHESYDGSVILGKDKYNLSIAGQQIICDGSTRWTHLIDDEEVQINTVEDDEDAMSPSKLLTSYDDKHKPKLIKETIVGGVEVYIIDLVPLKGESYFKVRLMINKKYQIISSKIFDKNNNTFEYKVKKFEHDLVFKDSDFVFDTTNNPDVEVNDLR